MQGLLNWMDRTLRALAKFESSRPGLILGTQITPRGWIFWIMIFIISKNSQQYQSNKEKNFIMSSEQVGH